MERRYNLHNSRAFATSYLEAVLFRFDFGPSLQYRDQTVNDILADNLPVSAALGVAALVAALVLGVTTGILGALRPGSLLDLSSLAMTLVGVSLPAFVTGSILLVVFGGLLRWAPVGGWGRAEHFVLPALTLGVLPAAYIARLIRLGLADVMNSDFIRTARAKGLSPTDVLFKHALKVAFLPVVSFLGPAAAAVLTGSFVVEQVFAIPGLGEHFVNAVLNKDQFLILGVVLIYSVLLVVFNLIVDVAYVWIDPRIKVV
jgi:oligopeptide transport system permease protein